MSPAQLSRLRPQISALSSLFDQPEKYIDALTKLLEQYRNDVEPTSDGIQPYSLVKKLNVPGVVISQLDVSYNHLVKAHSQQTIEIAKTIWKCDYIEYKQLSLLLLSKLPEKFSDSYYSFITENISEESETPLYFFLVEIASKNSEIQQDHRWMNIFISWVVSPDKRLKKFGIQAAVDFIQSLKQYPSPEFMKLIKPVFLNPYIAIHADLLGLVNLLADYSINETAAFLISIGVQNPNNDISKFLRKCAVFFPPPLSERIKNTSQL